MLVEFDDESDKVHVQIDGPCHFDKCLVLTKEFEGKQQIHHVQFLEALFQIKILDLPLMARNEYIGRMIGNFVDHVVEVDLVDGELSWGKFMRI